jgi:hypothetical protein
MDPIIFSAILPPIQTAITFSGNGDGARIKLDIPETDVAQAAKLLLMTGKELKVTVESA